MENLTYAPSQIGKKIFPNMAICSLELWSAEEEQKNVMEHVLSKYCQVGAQGPLSFQVLTQVKILIQNSGS